MSADSTRYLYQKRLIDFINGVQKQTDDSESESSSSDEEPFSSQASEPLSTSSSRANNGFSSGDSDL